MRQIQYQARAEPLSSIPSTAETFAPAWSQDARPRPSRRSALPALLAAITLAFVPVVAVSAETFEAAWAPDRPVVQARPAYTAQQSASALAFVPHVVVDAPVEAWQPSGLAHPRRVRRTAVPDTALDLFTRIDSPVEAWGQPFHAPIALRRITRSASAFVPVVEAAAVPAVSAWHVADPPTPRRHRSALRPDIAVDLSVTPTPETFAAAWGSASDVTHPTRIPRSAPADTAIDLFTRVDAPVEAWQPTPPGPPHRPPARAPGVAVAFVPVVIPAADAFVAAWTTDGAPPGRRLPRTAPADTALIPVFAPAPVDSPVDAWGHPLVLPPRRAPAPLLTGVDAVEPLVPIIPPPVTAAVFSVGRYAWRLRYGWVATRTGQ